MKRLALPALILCLCASATFAAGFPYMRNAQEIYNTPTQARVYPVMDTISMSLTATRGLYLVRPSSGTVRASIDSVINAWRNGGAVPNFARIQHIILWNNSQDEETMRMTLFHGSGTSSFIWVNQPYAVLDIPVEADSIRIQAQTAAITPPTLDIGYVLW